MLSRELIDLVNSGEAIAFVGSGVSTDAGLPSWSGLFDETANALEARGVDGRVARAAAAKNKIPEAFEALAIAASRDEIHSLVASQIEMHKQSGRHHLRLADWPFRFYVTTNYDRLIESASPHRLVTVGNKGAEIRKMSAGCRDVVWHIHGASSLSGERSQIVITKSDYDEFYPESNVVQTLRSLAQAFRCVFFGFGFGDPDFLHVLRAVGRLSHFGRPSFAFIANDPDIPARFVDPDQIRAEYNVEIVPYDVRGNDHSELHRLLEGYNPFLVRRSVSFGFRPTGTPSYEPSAASLRVQTSLDLGELSKANPGLHRTLVGARVLAKVRESPKLTESDLIRGTVSSDLSELAVREAVRELCDRGLLTREPTLDLTPEYADKTATAQARIELARDRFLSSLHARVSERGPVLDGRAETIVVEVVSEFLEALCRERGLGVAQNLATEDSNQASRRTVALLQELPQRLGSCSNRGEALMAIHVATDLLTRPNEAEAGFLGLLCQCYFGQHLVGASDNLSKIDLDLLSGTCYVLDASVLICLLAEGSEISEFTSALLSDLQRLGATLVTTNLLVDEVAEHANWALRLVTRSGEVSPHVIDALRGAGRIRPNQFLHGFYLGTSTDSSFASYIGRVFGVREPAVLSSDTVADRLKLRGISVLGFTEWEGFHQGLYGECEALQAEITNRRLGRGTFRHSRQTKAEAEVAVLVDRIRVGTLRPPGATVRDAFFLSSTRVVDDLPNIERRISLLPEGLAQWIWSSESTSSRHAQLVFEQLLWQLAVEGVVFVDKQTLLRRFPGVFEASKNELDYATRNRREFLVERYGPDPASAFSDADPVDTPRFAKEVHEVALAKMQHEIIEAKKREAAARAAAKLSDGDRDELAKLRARRQQRHAKMQKKKRAAESRKGKGRQRRKKRKE